MENVILIYKSENKEKALTMCVAEGEFRFDAREIVNILGLPQGEFDSLPANIFNRCGYHFAKNADGRITAFMDETEVDTLINHLKDKIDKTVFDNFVKWFWTDIPEVLKPYIPIVNEEYRDQNIIERFIEIHETITNTKPESKSGDGISSIGMTL